MVKALVGAPFLVRERMFQKVKFAKDCTCRIGFGKEVAYKKNFEGLIPDAHLEAVKTAGVLEEAASASKGDTKAKSVQ